MSGATKGFRFIDISSNNHPSEGTPLPFDKLKGLGFSGVMVKATQGLNYVNPFLEEDSKAIKEAGLHLGFYHFGMLNQKPGDQAEFCIRTVENIPGRDLGIALDIEDLSGSETWQGKATFSKLFLARLAQSKIGTTLYTNPDYLTNMPGAPWGHRVWLADWTTHVPRIPLWGWQSGFGPLQGWPTDVDQDTYFGES